jgi:YggT family protein
MIQRHNHDHRHNIASHWVSNNARIPALAKLMFYQIVSLLLEVAIGLLAGACLLRLYMQYLQIPLSVRSGNPLGGFIFALTDWIVLPLRRVVPAAGRWDLASLVATFLLELAQFSILWLLGAIGGSFVQILILAVFGVFRLALSAMTGLIIVYAVLSWVQTNSTFTTVIERLCAPPLKPIRKIVPPVGGIDLSPLVLLVLLQIAAIVLASIQSAALR